MTVKINTKDGQIELTDDVIATVVGGAATEIFGVVGMASKNAIKDNFQALLRKRKLRERSCRQNNGSRNYRC